MITKEGRTKILDFGLARQLGGGELEETMTAATTMTEPGGMAGTVPYMAPELLRGQPANQQSDIWALGVMLYEMATGQRPFRGNTGFELSSAIMKEPPAPLPTSVPAGLASIIRKCLTKEPEQRFERANEVWVALETLQTALGMVVAEAAKLTRHRRVRLITTVGTLAVVVGAALWWVFEHRAPGPSTTPSSEITATAVFPFTVSGTSGSVDVGEGMMDLLRVTLDGVGDLRSVDTNALMSSLAREGGGALDPETAANIARSLGAGLYVLGRVVVAGGRLQASATLYEVGGEVQHRATARVDGEEKLFVLADELAKQFLVGRTDSGGQQFLDVPFEALKPYLEGEKQLRAGEWELAVESFQRAVDVDSTFAYGWRGLVYATSFTTKTRLRHFAVEHALAFSDRLSTHDSQLIQVQHASIVGDTDRRERLLRAALGTHPDDMHAWRALAVLLWGTAPLKGRSFDEAWDAFNKAVEFGMPETYGILFVRRAVAGAGGKTQEYAALLDRLLELNPKGDFAPSVRAERAFLRGDVAEQRQALRELERAPESLVSGTAHGLVCYTGHLGGAKQVAGLLIKSPRSAETRARGHIRLAHIELAHGRWNAAMAEFENAEVLEPSYALEYRALVATVPFLDAPHGELEAIRSALIPWDAEAIPLRINSNAQLDPHEGAHAHLRVYLLGLLSAVTGDTAMAERYATELENLDDAPDKFDLTRGLALAHSVRAQIDLFEGHAERALSFVATRLTSRRYLEREVAVPPSTRGLSIAMRVRSYS
jgi:tetratricopeptide (TPR) repeat protein